MNTRLELMELLTMRTGLKELIESDVNEFLEMS